MPHDNDETRSSGVTPPPGKVGAKGDPGQAPPPRGYWLIKEIGDRIARALGLREYRGEVSDKVVPVMIVKDISQSQEDVPSAVYDVITVDLAVARDAVAVVKDKSIAAVWVDDITVGGLASLHIGPSGAAVAAKDGKAFEVDPPEEVQIRVTNTAQAGATLKLGIGFGVRRGA